MNVKKTVSVALLVVLFATLSAALGTYNQIQAAMSLEGNGLYSTQSVAVNAKISDVVSVLESSHSNARLYRDISGDGSIRPVWEIGNPSPLPIHSGRQLVAGENRVALVGADVRVQRELGKQYYTFEGSAYLVVGQLGLRAKSLVSRTVLLQNPELFEDKIASRLIIDGTSTRVDIAHAFTEAPLTENDSATNRRTNIDVVSPVLLRFGWALTFLGSVATAILAASNRRQLNAVRFQLGHRRVAIIATSLVSLIASVIFPLTLVYLITSATSPPVQSDQSILWNTLAPQALIMLVFMIMSARNLWRRASWA